MGVALDDVEPLTELMVRTLNSQYRIVVSDGADVILQGGQFFPEPVHAKIDGSGFGGSFLKIGWIGIGFCMEIFALGNRIITSPVRDIRFTRAASIVAQ